MATRGRNLSLARVTYSRGDGVEAFLTETLTILEISADERISAIIVFDVDDFDAAIAELDARYLAGEAAAHSETWLAIAEVYAALNRAEMPTTATDFVDIDHRSLAAIGSGDLMAYVQAALKDARRHRHLRRDRPSADRPRRGHHPSGDSDVTRRVRRRMAFNWASS